MAPGVHPAAGRALRPWRNGGGLTAEILASPEGAGLDGFAWRLSTARVERSGPFSLFPGVDRVLAVLEGGPMRLEVAGEVLRVDAGSAPVAFPGDRPCVAHLDGGPLLDLNLMVRRPGRGDVRRRVLDGAAPAVGADGEAFALLLAPAGGLGRLDLVDLRRADPGTVASLAGVAALAISVRAG